MKSIHIDASKSYDVLIAENILKDCGRLCSNAVGVCRAAIVSDSVVYPLYGDIVKKSLEEAGFSTVVHVFKNGEASKNTEEYVKIVEFLAENQLTRSDIVVALGGGVTGDMAGFAAASYLRGIRFVQIPTTFLAAVDSSVGGKTGINLKSGKNLCGAFWQPSVVICDTKTLDTLSDEIFADGISESIKCGVLESEELFAKMSGDIRSNIEDIIAECVTIKCRAVCEDEFDTGARQKLNLGHTVGHAIEKLSEFKISHGHAVAIGMAVIARASENAGLCENGTTDKLVSTLEKCGLPSVCEYSGEELEGIMLSDKKRAGDSITLVIPKKIGECVLHKIPTDELLEFIKKGLE